MSPATAAAQTQRKPRPSPSTHVERPPRGAVLGVTAAYADRVDDARPFAVASRTGGIVPTDRYADRTAAVRGATQIRRDLATVAAGLDRPR